ncbi:ATP-dependent exoDNAse (exonuclease V) beta subunit (contains helicase and exonuclease domains) [Cyclobacterium xiamenense]|uniref:DNA 3'-5' helicase n=1 Tax=Cyclobacterium xiamenense TaxID=1297121 RepID=A0A1H7B1D4_9BACT|nr:UvrD-helicase domain-containing protein [Cyclobacterium xiamenense]SEJ71278.1 ATP-dependent exoDNAse (exonuclease V) beta subunit (contains helicase and exonuclease domains) [Cyclobacterium xiamenense]
MAIPTPFQLYKSSAGSGKTYTLTTAYLKLALANPLAFRQILAVTFTNKATQEMKERILEELLRLRGKVDETQQMDQDLMAKWALAPAELSARAAATLTAILHDYAAFSVSTIDSFFQQVIRAFAREIDLQAKYDVELDLDRVMERIVDRLMTRVVDEPDLHRWLVAFSLHKIQEGKTWDTKKAIFDLGKKIFQEDFKRAQPEIKTFLEGPENLKKFGEYLHRQKRLVVSEAVELKAEAQRIRERHGLEWTDFRGGQRSFAHQLEKLGIPSNPVPELSDSQKDNIPDPDTWYTKTSTKKAAIIAANREGLAAIFARFEPLRGKWNTLDAMSKNLYVFGLFGYLLEELNALKEEENILLISEASDFLRSITAENDAPFIYEKVGNRFRHFLLDEFQDTSGFQWESFRPLLLNSLSMGNTNLIVGDVKQSIYRWRGGEMRLLMEQVERDTGHFGLEINQLDTNFRSLPQVVAFNNSLFSGLSGLLEAALSEDLGEDMGILIAKAYAEIHQKVSPRQLAKGKSGKVKLEFLVPENDRNFADTALEALPGMIDELLAKGYQLKDIALLVRKNGQAAQIADILMAHGHQHPDKKYDVISDEALFLNKSAVVRCLLAALKLVSDPSEDLAKTNLWVQWARAKQQALSPDFFLTGALPAPFAGHETAFYAKMEGFKRLPLLDLLEALIDLLGFNEALEERAYLSGLKESVYDFVAKNRADLGNFLEWWALHGHKRTVKLPDTHNAIRILTIHKSKGLQFKVVVLPFLDWKLFDTVKDSIVWTQYLWEQGMPPVVMPLTIRKGLLNSEFAGVYRLESLLSHLDNLNMLYVAFTRAEEVIWGLAPQKNQPSSNLTTVADLLLQAMALRGGGEAVDFPDYFDDEKMTFELGKWPDAGGTSGLVAPPQEKMAWNYRPWEDSLQVRQVVGSFDESGVFSRRNFGQLVHALIEKSKTKPDFFLELDALYFDGSVDAAERETLQAQFNHLCQVPEFNGWFDENYQILTEQGILLPGGGSKRPDRLVFKKDLVEVVDFKTGKEVDRYRDQVQGYMDLIRRLEPGNTVIGYICYLESGSIIKLT